jgi:hypothetical protein
MAKEKNEKKPKATKGFMTPLIVGMFFLGASWFYWPRFLIFFMRYYFQEFHSSINPLFVLALYLFVVLLLVFILARLFKTWLLFLGTFLPIVIYLGYHEWNSYHTLHKYIDAGGFLTLLFNVFSNRVWW